MNPSTMQTPPLPHYAQPHFHHQMPPAMPPVRAQQQSNLVLAVALAGLGTYAFYNTLGDMQTVIYTVGGAYVLRILMQNPEIMRQVQARLAALQSGRSLQSLPPMNSQGMNHTHNNSNGPALPRIDTSFNHPSGNGYQPLQATNGGSGLYDDFENSMATPTTPDPSYAHLPGNGSPANRMQSRPDSRASTVQQRGASPTITVATATPTVRNAPSIGMATRPGTEFFDPRASTTSTFSAFAVPMTNPFASYQHYDNGTVNGERLLSPIHEDEHADRFPARGPFDTRASLVPGSGWDPRASIVSTFSAFAVPKVNPFASYTFYDAGTIGGERVTGTETLSERIAAPPHRSDTSATVTQATETLARAEAPAKHVSQSPYDAGAVIGQQLARRASRCYTGVTGAGLPGAGTGAIVTPAHSPTTVASPSGISMGDYVPKRKHRQPTVAARVGEVAAPGGGIAPAHTTTGPAMSPQQERSTTPVIRAPPRPPTPGAKRPSSRTGTVSPTAPVPLPTTTRVELPARKSTVTPTNRGSNASPLNRSANGSPLRRSASGSRTPGHSPSTSANAPSVPRLMSPSPEPPVRFFEAPLMNSPLGPSSIHPISPPFVASATASSKGTNRSASGYDSDSSHASSSTSSRRSQEHTNNYGYENVGSHARTDSLGLPSYEKHATTIFTLVPKRPGYVPQIQAILKTARSTWLALPGTVSHEVGQDDATGSVVVVETYESSESMDDFEKSKERDSILSRLSTFIDDSKTSVVRMPGSSAATRLR